MGIDKNGEANEASDAQSNVLVKSEPVEDGTPIVCGYDFNQGIDYERLFATYLTTGFQATNLARAVEVSIFCFYKNVLVQ